MSKAADFLFWLAGVFWFGASIEATMLSLGMEPTWQRVSVGALIAVILTSAGMAFDLKRKWRAAK